MEVLADELTPFSSYWGGTSAWMRSHSVSKAVQSRLSEGLSI